MTADLEGHVAVVTGAAGGIGRALVDELLRAGCKVALADVDAEALQATMAELHADDAPVVGVETDVRFAAASERLRQETEQELGPVDIVCLNAGVSPSGRVIDTSESTWRWLLEVNVLGVVHGLRAFGPGLVRRGRGHVVITASTAGLIPTPALGAYSATKHALVGLAGAARKELAASGVGVSLLCPANVRTRIYASERNRPPELAGISHTDANVATKYREAVDGSRLQPADVAAAAVAAIRDNRFLVLPSPEVDPMIDVWLEEIRAAMTTRPSRT
ncbi:MAG: family NAD(P)-dependent oxidoreductase [Actinomycetia bacterium]|nr:family NAD(P)-dependent oxidoreductase [Actinomycetes bacterium]